LSEKDGEEEETFEREGTWKECECYYFCMYMTLTN